MSKQEEGAPTKKQGETAAVLEAVRYLSQERQYILADSSYARVLSEMKIGERHGEQNKTWKMSPCEYVYMISCLDVPEERVLAAYSLMNSSEIDETAFYLTLRKHSKLVKKSGDIFRVYENGHKYGSDCPSSKIKLCSCDSGVMAALFEAPEKQEYNKVAIIRNRDVVVLDVE